MIILGIDPDWKKCGYALFDGKQFTKIGTIDTDNLRDGIFDVASSKTELETQILLAVEVAILEKTVIFGARNMGAVISRGIALARCQFVAGYVCGLADALHLPLLKIKPSDWNSARRKKEDCHRDIFLQYPEIKALRSKRNNGVNDDSLDAALIAKEGYRQWKLNKQR